METEVLSAQEALDRFGQSSKLLQLLDQEGRSLLAQAATAFNVPPGTNVVKQGDVSDSFYFIAMGGVRVIVLADNKPKEVARLGAGSFFGEMGVLTGEVRSATVQTIGKSILIRFPKEKALPIFQRYPAIKEVFGLVSLQRAEQNIQEEMED